MTLNDLERQNRGFMDFLTISGCDTRLYHSQDGAALLSLCDPNREFDIGQNMQNLARLGTTSKFDGEYFQNGLTLGCAPNF